MYVRARSLGQRAVLGQRETRHVHGCPGLAGAFTAGLVECASALEERGVVRADEPEV